MQRHKKTLWDPAELSSILRHEWLNTENLDVSWKLVCWASSPNVRVLRNSSFQHQMKSYRQWLLRKEESVFSRDKPSERLSSPKAKSQTHIHMNNNTKSTKNMCVCIIYIYTLYNTYVHELRETGWVGWKREGCNNVNMEIRYEILKNNLRLGPLRSN